MFGNILNKGGLLARRPNVSADIEQRILIEGTANYTHLYPSIIVAGAKVQLELKNLVSGSAIYEPYSYMKIKNTSDENIKIYKNENSDDTVIVLSGMVETIKLDGLRSLIMENISATDTSANEIVIEYGIDRAGADKYAQQKMARGI